MVEIGNIPEKEFKIIIAQRISVQLFSRVQLFVTPWTAAHQASLSITNSRSLLKLMSIESVMLLPLIFPSIRVFSNESALPHQVAKVLEFQFQHQSSNEYSGLISFRMDWFDLAIQGTLKSLLQHHSLKASILWRSAFFIVTFTSIHDYWKKS